MGKVGEVLRRKAVIATAGAALLAAGVGIGSAAALSSPGTAPVSDQTQVTEPAPTSDAQPTTEPAPTTQAEPIVQQPEQSAPTATVPAVTTPKSEPTAEPTPTETPTRVGTNQDGVTPYDPTAPWVQGGKTYVPAPMPTMEKLPGEGGDNGSQG